MFALAGRIEGVQVRLIHQGVSLEERERERALDRYVSTKGSEAIFGLKTYCGITSIVLCQTTSVAFTNFHTCNMATL